MFSVLPDCSLIGALHCLASSALKKKFDGSVSAGSPLRRRLQFEKNCCSYCRYDGDANGWKYDSNSSRPVHPGNSIPCLYVALHAPMNSSSETPRNLRNRLKSGVVPSPTPIVGMFGDSISVILLPAMPRLRRNMTAVIQPALPPPAITTCSGGDPFDDMKRFRSPDHSILQEPRRKGIHGTFRTPFDTLPAKTGEQDESAERKPRGQ
jgi:hypothetical protein